MSEWRERVFTPELFPRNGERNAWLSALILAVLWLVFKVMGWEVPLGLTVLAIAILGIAVLIRWANWMERKTLLAFGSRGIYFENGLRKVSLAWGEIEQVRVRPALWGKRVQVRGGGTQFAFYTLGEAKSPGIGRVRTGFAQGEEILRHIVLSSGLRMAEQLGEEVIYVRQAESASG